MRFSPENPSDSIVFPVSDFSSSTVRQAKPRRSPRPPKPRKPPRSLAKRPRAPGRAGSRHRPSPRATTPGEGPGIRPLRVHVEKYDGPLDLLLDLIRSQKINIYDIPIAQITAQYLDYLRQAEDLNIDLGGEFVFMAATLIHIKSKMLLPKDPSVPEEEQEDPRDELVQRLLEHEKFLQAAQMLREKRVVEENVWSNPPLQAFLDEEEDPGFAVTVFDLVKTFEKVLERYKNRPTYQIGDRGRLGPQPHRVPAKPASRAGRAAGAARGFRAPAEPPRAAGDVSGCARDGAHAGHRCCASRSSSGRS